MPNEAENKLHRLALSQHGIATTTQASGLGIGKRLIRRRLDEGLWQQLHPGVIAPSRDEISWAGSLLAACRWAKDGVASHRSAARLWELPGGSLEPIDIVSTRCHLSPRSGLHVHFTDRLLPHHVMQIRGIPVTTVERTVMDLCGILPEAGAAAAVDDVVRRRLTSLPALDALVGEVAKRGRRGCGVLRQLVREREGLPETPHSPLESKFFQLIRRSSLPMPECQYVIEDNGQFVARVDFAYPDLRLAIECQSYTWHSGQEAWERDVDRLSKLHRLGWIAHLVKNRDLDEDPDGTLNRIWALYQQRAA